MATAPAKRPEVVHDERLLELLYQRHVAARNLATVEHRFVLLASRHPGSGIVFRPRPSSCSPTAKRRSSQPAARPPRPRPGRQPDDQRP